MLLDLVFCSYELGVLKKLEAATVLIFPPNPLPIPWVPIPDENKLQGWLVIGSSQFTQEIFTNYYEQMDAVAWDLFDFHTRYAAFQETPRLQAEQGHWWRYLPPCSETARSDPRNQGS